MRLNNYNLKTYLNDRRIAYIQKAHEPLHLQVQLVNNKLIDKYILNSNKNHLDTYYDPFSEDNISVQILGHNRLSTSQDLQRILKQSKIPSNTVTRTEARKTINDVAETITSLETERILKNLHYVNSVLQNADVSIKKYEALIQELPTRVSRKEVLERCILNNTELPSNKRLEWLERNLQRGASYNKQYTYKELNQLSNDLQRYKTHRLDYETAIMENRQANREGYELVNESKSWIWSTLEKTRHEGMDGETVPLTSPFEVINEVTGDVDFLMFPGDVVNDHNNCSNICNCGCGYEINTA